MIDLSYIFAFLFVMVACIRILHVNSRAEWPELFSNGVSYSQWCANVGIEITEGGVSIGAKKDNFIKEILKHAPIFSKP